MLFLKNTGKSGHEIGRCIGIRRHWTVVTPSKITSAQETSWGFITGRYNGMVFIMRGRYNERRLYYLFFSAVREMVYCPLRGEAVSMMGITLILNGFYIGPLEGATVGRRDNMLT
ncbi:hypothetical protein AVEN_202028-1 [Araneus ventricosus]|uniref:Uncharacterized protein n=1 Tax=Araneus ventricosus TaxID=182803 RepID=A0A4Y2R0P1_ARAVE|nr:hypothetical protein AVEN_202028-1 [Araneus ventricosus]